MTVWLTVIVVGLITYLIRLSFIALVGYKPLPPSIQRGLRMVPPAVLTAIVFPELFLADGLVDLSLGNFRLIAGLVAVLVAWRTRNVALTIILGMAALLLGQFYFG